MCLDLTFIAVLLEEGYGLKPKTPLKVRFLEWVIIWRILHFTSFDIFWRSVFWQTTFWRIKLWFSTRLYLNYLFNRFSFQLYKKIDGHEISWALGAAYNILTSNKSSQL